ncbi:ABC transporter substrate-binding protein [Falsigemmobacter faecalis]|uniref:ABC transporter substrate-binding protein n=1 Tax=Falsigemmobacter faecalis TaxID=2488730 RepID=A0A3P3D743_9RHOB|nr:ABC transporter substrate-binding protein [Falsigemmobacter faecalis]RRH70149.1 ABC transporter substrate-binding protein [Falsigemmobacter faecalis]
MKKLTGLVAALALSCLSVNTAAFAAPNENLPEAIKSAGVLVLGTTSSIGLPWTSIKEGTSDQYTGVEVELATEIAKRLGLELKVQNLGFDSLIPSLEAKRIDIIMSNMLDTPVRQKKVDFVDHIYGGSAMLQTASAAEKIDSLDGLCGRKASALRGAMEAISAAEQSEKCVAEGKAAIDIQLYPDTGAQLTALRSDRTDVALTDLIMAGMLERDHPEQFDMVGAPFNFGPCGIAVAKESSLTGLIAEALDTMVADGTYAEIMSRNGFVKESFITKATINGVKGDE